MGELFQHGGIIRDSLGRIYKHLKEVPVPEGNEEAAGRLAEYLKRPNVIGLVVLGTVAAGATAVTIYSVKKRANRRTPVVPECVELYNTSLGVYLDAIRAGRLDVDIIDQFISNLDAVKIYSDENDSFRFDLKTKHGKSLFNLVIAYTKRLAQANDISLNEFQHLEAASEDDVVELRRLLSFQRTVFAKAA